MSQQINLYQPIFRKERIVFSARTILWLAVGFGAILIVWSLLVGQRISGLEAEHERQVAAEQRAITQLTELQRSMPPSEPDAELIDRVDALEQRRDNLDESLDALDRRLPRDQTALGERLDALARQVPEGLWLTGLDMGAGGARLSLHGRALSASLVPNYVDALADEPLLAGMGFRKVHVSAATDAIPGVEFTLSTVAEEQP